MARLLLSIALGMVLAAGASHSAWAANVTVYAAASLKDALDDLARQFEVASGNKVIAVYADVLANVLYLPALDPLVLAVGASDSNGTASMSDDTVPFTLPRLLAAGATTKLTPCTPRVGAGTRRRPPSPIPRPPARR